MALQDTLPLPDAYPLLTDDCCEQCGQPSSLPYCFNCATLLQLDDLLVITYSTTWKDKRGSIGSKLVAFKGETSSGEPELNHANSIAGLLYHYLDANWDVISSAWHPTVVTFVPSHPDKIAARKGLEPMEYIIDKAPRDRERFGITPLLQKTRNEDQPERNREPDPSLWQVVDSGDVTGERVIVIDDRFTTGSTLEGVAQMLKNAGAEAVYGLVLARQLSIHGSSSEESFAPDSPHVETLTRLRDTPFDYSDCRLRS